MRKRSIKISGHATSVSLEASFWHALSHIAFMEKTSIAALIRLVDAQRLSAQKTDNLSSSLRVFILNYFLPPEAILIPNEK